MSGKVFKRCTRCGSRVPRRRCAKCNGDTAKWAFVVDVGKDLNDRRQQRMRTARSRSSSGYFRGAGMEPFSFPSSTLSTIPGAVH